MSYGHSDTERVIRKLMAKVPTGKLWELAAEEGLSGIPSNRPELQDALVEQLEEQIRQEQDRHIDWLMEDLDALAARTKRRIERLKAR